MQIFLRLALSEHTLEVDMCPCYHNHKLDSLGHFHQKTFALFLKEKKDEFILLCHSDVLLQHTKSYHANGISSWNEQK